MSAHSAETYSSTPSSSASTSLRKKKSKNKRRFSEEQIKSMESMFEIESRLDPRKKVQLARELGLQPRQLAIWFQNRRARCKSKQLERDYFILRANYNTVASKFEALKKDNHALLIQLQKLKDVMQNPQDQTCYCKKVKAGMARGSDNGETIKCEAEVKPSSSMERSEQVLGVLSDDDSSIKAEYFGLQDEPTLLNFVDQHTDGSLTSPEDWGKLESDDLLAQSDSGYQLWDF